MRWRLDAERDHGDRVHACERRQIVAVALGEDGDRLDRSHEPALEPVPREVVGVAKRPAGAERRLAHGRGCAARGRLVDDEDTRRPPAAKRGQVLTHHLVVDVDEVRPPFLAQLADARVALGDAPVGDPARTSLREPAEPPPSRVARRDRGPRDRRHRFAALGDARIDRRFVLAAKADERDAVALREPPDQLRHASPALMAGLSEPMTRLLAEFRRPMFFGDTGVLRTRAYRCEDSLAFVHDVTNVLPGIPEARRPLCATGIEEFPLGSQESN